MAANWVQEKLQTFGEKVMDSMLDSLLANQNTHLTNLQQWNFAKFVNRVINSKYFYKQPNVKRPSISDSYDSRNPHTIGVLHLSVDSAKVLLYQHRMGLSTQKQLKFQLVVTCGGMKQTSPLYSIDDFEASTRSIAIQETFTFEIVDLWTDLVIELNCIRPNVSHGLFLHEDAFDAADPIGSSVTGIATPQSDRGLRSETAKERIQSDRLSSVASGEQRGSSGDVDKDVATSDLQDHATSSDPVSNRLISLSKPENTNGVDVRYGRVILPLNTFLCSLCNLYDPFSKSTTFGQFWCHIYPHNNKLKEPKYFRPISGYEEFGMKNPLKTLGFLRIKMIFEWHVRPFLGPLYSNLNVPAQQWVLPTKPEPHYLENFTDRAIENLASCPRWMEKIFMQNRGNSRNMYDWLCIVLYWVLLFYCFVFSTVRTMPILISACIILVSLMYKIGNNSTTPIGTLYCSMDELERNDLLGDSKVEQYIYAGATQTAEKLDNLDAHQDLTEISEDYEITKDTHHRQFQKVARPKEAMPNHLLRSHKIKSMKYRNLSLRSKHIEKSSSKAKSRGRTKYSNLSVIQSPFGEIPLTMNVKQQHLLVPFPIFADDVSEPIMSRQLQKLIALFTYVQFAAGHLSTAVEKLRHALNWEDPFSAILTYFILMGFSLLFSMLLCLSTQIAFYWWRCLFFALFVFMLWKLYLCWSFIAYHISSGHEAALHATAANEFHQILDETTVPQQNISNSTYKKELEPELECNLQVQKAFTRTLPLPLYPPATIGCNRGFSVLESPVLNITEDGANLQPQYSATTLSFCASIYHRLKLLKNELIFSFINRSGYKFAKLCVAIVYPAYAILSYCGKHVVTSFCCCGNYIAYWWIRLPDEREMDHRSISATQFIHPFSQLVQDDEKHFEKLCASNSCIDRGGSDSLRCTGPGCVHPVLSPGDNTAQTESRVADVQNCLNTAANDLEAEVICLSHQSSAIPEAFSEDNGLVHSASQILQDVGNDKIESEEVYRDVTTDSSNVAYDSISMLKCCYQKQNCLDAEARKLASSVEATQHWQELALTPQTTAVSNSAPALTSSNESLSKNGKDANTAPEECATSCTADNSIDAEADSSKRVKNDEEPSYGGNVASELLFPAWFSDSAKFDHLLSLDSYPSIKQFAEVANRFFPKLSSEALAGYGDPMRIEEEEDTTGVAANPTSSRVVSTGNVTEEQIVEDRGAPHPAVSQSQTFQEGEQNVVSDMRPSRHDIISTYANAVMEQTSTLPNFAAYFWRFSDKREYLMLGEVSPDSQDTDKED